jgi:prolipoprotein diacylglyceryltransferase
MYKHDATFEPTYFYESAWDFLIAGFLVWLERNREIRPPGLFALFVTAYGTFRIFEELIRVDPSHHIFGLRLNFYVACLTAISGSIWFGWTQGWWGRRVPADPADP